MGPVCPAVQLTNGLEWGHLSLTAGGDAEEPLGQRSAALLQKWRKQLKSL